MSAEFDQVFYPMFETTFRRVKPDNVEYSHLAMIFFDDLETPNLDREFSKVRSFYRVGPGLCLIVFLSKAMITTKDNETIKTRPGDAVLLKRGFYFQDSMQFLDAQLVCVDPTGKGKGKHRDQN